MVLRNVLDFLIPGLWLLLGLACAVYLWRVASRHGLLEATSRLFSKRVLYPLTGLLMMTVVSASLVFIDPTEVGVVVSLFSNNGVRERPMRPGLNWRLPLAEHVVRYPTVMQSYTMSGRAYEGNELGDDAVRARTANGQVVIIDVTSLFRIDPSAAVRLHLAWQDRYVGDFIRPGLRAFVRSEASRFNVDEINSEKRQAFEEALNDLTDTHCKGTGILPEAVLVRNITFSKEYASSVEEKMTALQRVTETEYRARQVANLAKGDAEKVRVKAKGRADAIVTVAEAEAEAHVVKARAEAEALQLIGSALEQRDNLLTYRYIDKLSPNITAMLLPSDSPLILPMPRLGEQQPAALPAGGKTPPAQAVAGPVDSDVDLQTPQWAKRLESQPAMESAPPRAQ